MGTARERGVFERPKGSGIWWINWYSPDGKRHREKIGSKEAAKKVYARRASDSILGKKIPELNRKELTLIQLMERYQDEIKANKKSWEWDLRIQGRWREVLGDRPARSIVPGDIEGVKARWLQSLTPATVNRRIAYLKSIYNKAIRDGILESNPIGARRVKMLREAPPKDRVLEPEEEARLLPQLPTWDRLGAILSLHAGLRISELVERKRDEIRRDVLFLPDPKGGRPQKVKLNPVALAAAQELLASHESPWLMPGRTPGRPMARRALAKRLELACQAIGIQGVTWHTFRHTFVSRLVLQGENLLVVQKLARHESLEMTLRYAHLSPDHSTGALDRLAGNWSQGHLYGHQVLPMPSWPRWKRDREG